ncbi:hypothetical protein D8674_006232 [Pyrus ussuriensis x Pyrus communis]|uniref:DDE Tnp4 domain-containing protein n=1 Tax=Pyrus ussuriensis x Pyrus communis TaxID=2448454 RepID=A0A5N5FTS6_9ROSA|nr:hypothetical protein D8674_006232 [Pyrus ussuriensis x Pyrus communis]
MSLIFFSFFFFVWIDMDRMKLLLILLLEMYFNSVLQGILRLQGILLKVPQPVPIDSTDPRWRCFKNCLGALDGTHIDVHVPEIDKPRYRNRKGRVATNVLGGSALDSRVLHDAITRPNGFKVPTGKIIS